MEVTILFLAERAVHCKAFVPSIGLCEPQLPAHLHVALRADWMVAASEPIEVMEGVAADRALFILVVLSRFTARTPPHCL